MAVASTAYTEANAMQCIEAHILYKWGGGEWRLAYRVVV